MQKSVFQVKVLYKYLKYVCRTHLYSAAITEVAQTISTLASSCMHIYLCRCTVDSPCFQTTPEKNHPKNKTTYKTTKNCAQLLLFQIQVRPRQTISASSASGLSSRVPLYNCTKTIHVHGCEISI